VLLGDVMFFRGIMAQVKKKWRVVNLCSLLANVGSFGFEMGFELAHTHREDLFAMVEEHVFSG